VGVVVWLPSRSDFSSCFSSDFSEISLFLGVSDSEVSEVSMGVSVGAGASVISLEGSFEGSVGASWGVSIESSLGDSWEVSM
jgi:hypothetical protein